MNISKISFEYFDMIDEVVVAENLDIKVFRNYGSNTNCSPKYYLFVINFNKNLESSNILKVRTAAILWLVVSETSI